MTTVADVDDPDNGGHDGRRFDGSLSADDELFSGSMPDTALRGGNGGGDALAFFPVDFKQKKINNVCRRKVAVFFRKFREFQFSNTVRKIIPLKALSK